MNKAKSNRKLQKQLDTQWKINVRKHWNNKCAVWGKTNCKLDCHHIVSRSIKELRHDVLNGILLCSGCHLFNRKLSAHKGSLLFIDWLSKNYTGGYAYLIAKLGEI